MEIRKENSPITVLFADDTIITKVLELETKILEEWDDDSTVTIVLKRDSIII